MDSFIYHRRNTNKSAAVIIVGLPLISYCGSLFYTLNYHKNLLIYIGLVLMYKVSVRYITGYISKAVRSQLSFLFKIVALSLNY